MLRKIISNLFGVSTRTLVVLVGIFGAAGAIANYTVTQGSGTDFGSRVNSGIHYAQQLICDMNVASVSGPCAAVAAGNTISASATAIAIGGTVTVLPGNTANTTPWLVNVNNTLTALSLGGNSASPVADPSTDPCQMIANSTTVIAIAAATNTQVIAASSSNRNYICSVDLFSKAGVDVSVIEGTGGTCGSGTAGIIGTATVTGISIAAQGGVVKGGAGRYVWRTNGTNTGTCIVTGSANPLTGFLKFVQAP